MNLYFIGRGIVLKGMVKYYGSGKNIPRTFGHTDGNSRGMLTSTTSNFSGGRTKGRMQYCTARENCLSIVSNLGQPQSL